VARFTIHILFFWVQDAMEAYRCREFAAK